MKELTKARTIYDYSELLQVYGAAYSPVDYYWQVGKANQVQGWVLHLSVILVQIEKLLRDIIPELLEKELPFRIVRDANLALHSLEGGLGYTYLGKMVTIYPRNDEQAVEVAKWLIGRTSIFRGPHIPTDRHLGGIVYTRYGSINPILLKDNNGEPIKHIYDITGQLVRDPYNVPFILPEGITWPFKDIVPVDRGKRRKLLNYRYYPLFVLKPDAKGDVIKALFFKRPWQIKPCLIKQGRPNMFADEHGRDIRDRLKWQYDLYVDLHQDISMPKIFDYFEEDGTTYLAMEYIKGTTLTNWIGLIYKERSWQCLSPSDRLKLLDQLLKILDIIQRMHKRNYVHRDITPDNFLIDRKENIFLIDLELSWCAIKNPPQPPFQLGTPGHMSPEQFAAQMPTVKEDIFGIGSLVFVFITNLYALKITGQEPSQMLQSLEFFTGDPVLANCINSCWSKRPTERPSLDEVIKVIVIYREKWAKRNSLDNRGSMPKFDAPIDSEIRSLAQKGINNLGSQMLLSPKNRWISRSLQKEIHIANRQIGMELYEGWHTGMAGPLWLVGLAKKVGLSIEACKTPYQQSCDYIKQNRIGQYDKISPGLYVGSAGIALALAEGLNSGLIPPEPDVLERIQYCFSVRSDRPGLAEGISGQGLALMHCNTWLDQAFSKRALLSYVNILIDQQRKNGSWNDYTGIDQGAAGITLFLLSYLKETSDDTAEDSIIRALNWLNRQVNAKFAHYSWPFNTQTGLIDKWSIGIGQLGIVLSFIKAYEVLNVASYRKTAEQCLFRITPYPITLDLTLGSGLAGLGETYLEAFRVFKDPIWLDRATWIATVLFHCCRPNKDNTCYWLTWITDVTTADLFYGNGGIIHFLMRYSWPELLGHPFNH